MKRAKRIARQRRRRRYRVRNALKAHSSRPRLSVFRSHKHIYAQVIDDRAGRTLAAASTLDKEVRQQVSYGGNKPAAAVVGGLIARRALQAGVKQVVFDRREYKYHGRVAALADAARDAGLDLGPKKALAEPEPAPQAQKGPSKPRASKKTPAAPAQPPS
ncbi:MAG: 50S ribosomal protein L18 [Thermoguttaceae bacterium]